MTRYLIAYGATATAFLAIDFVWLAWIAKRFYAGQLGHLLLERPNFGAAAVFYAVYVVGIVVFAVAPALRDGSPALALAFGALFGFLAYATYDMTNFATLKGWPLTVSLVDIAWGTCLTGGSALAGYLVTRLLSNG